MIVYDITDRESFINTQNWLNDVNRYANEKVPKMLVGNKCDLTENRAVSKEEAEDYATKFGMNYIETSAKTSSNVDEAFSQLVKTTLDNLRVNSTDNKQGKININSGTSVTRSKCC